MQMVYEWEMIDLVFVWWVLWWAPLLSDIQNLFGVSPVLKRLALAHVSQVFFLSVLITRE